MPLIVGANLVASGAVLVALTGTALAAPHGRTSRSKAVGFIGQPVLTKTSGGAFVSYRLDRQVRSRFTSVRIAGQSARVNVDGPSSSAVYQAFVRNGELRAGRVYTVCIRVVSRSGGIVTRRESLYLHKRFPRG